MWSTKPVAQIQNLLGGATMKIFEQNFSAKNSNKQSSDTGVDINKFI